MVVETPISDDKKNKLENCLEEITGNSIYFNNISRAEDGVFDYVVSYEEHTNYEMRSCLCKVKWHDDKQDWELKIKRKGVWKS